MSKRDNSSSQRPVIQAKWLVPRDYILAYIWTVIVLEPYPYNRQFISYGVSEDVQTFFFFLEVKNGTQRRTDSTCTHLGFLSG